jgi:hypothetical protein
MSAIGGHGDVDAPTSELEPAKDVDVVETTRAVVGMLPGRGSDVLNFVAAKVVDGDSGLFFGHDDEAFVRMCGVNPNRRVVAIGVATRLVVEERRGLDRSKTIVIAVSVALGCRPMNDPKFVLKRSGAHFYFYLTASNGEVVLHSELYRWRGAAEDGIASVKENAQRDERYDRKESKDGQRYFVLKARNGEVVGTSEMYREAARMEWGLASVKENAARAEVEA